MEVHPTNEETLDTKYDGFTKGVDELIKNCKLAQELRADLRFTESRLNERTRLAITPGARKARCSAISLERRGWEEHGINILPWYGCLWLSWASTWGNASDNARRGSGELSAMPQRSA
jgi:hypothetical protein